MFTIKKPHCGRTHYIIIGERDCFKDCNQRMHTTGKHRWLRKTGEDMERKRGSEIWKGRSWTAKATVWFIESKGLTLRNINKSHLRRSIRASASVDTSIRADRYEHPRRSMRMTKVGSMKRKRDGVNEGKERCVPPFLRSPPNQTWTQSVSICEYNLIFFLLESPYKKCLREEWGKFTGYQLLSSFWLKVARTDEDGNMTRWDRGTLPIRNLYPKWWMLRFGRIRKVTNRIWTLWFIVSYWWVTQDFWLRTKFAVFCREMRSKKRLFMY